MSLSPELPQVTASAARSMHVITFPVNQVECCNDGRFYIWLRGQRRPVVWIDDVGCWFTLGSSSSGMVPSAPVWISHTGEWEEGSPQTFASRPARDINGEQQIVILPAVPVVHDQQQNIIRVIHYIWIGETAIPDELYERMQNNVRRCPSWRFILHVHPTRKKNWQRLRTQFPASARIALKDLRNCKDFNGFLASEPGRYYLRFLERRNLNYGAAADILRLFVLHRSGGLYMDVDDEVEAPVPCGFSLKAGKDDLLLSGRLTVPVYDFHGFGNSMFACHAGNHILAEMLDEICRRIRGSDDFFRMPRPWYNTTSKLPEGEMLSYIRHIFYMTGPVMFTDVLKKCRPALFSLEPDLVLAYKTLNVTPSEPRIISEEYMQAFESAAHSLIPLSGPIFRVKAGKAHSWNPPSRA